MCIERGAFESLVRKNAREAAEFRSDPYLIGYFLDNELPWWGEFGWKSAGQKSLFEMYAGYDGEDANKRAFVRFMKEYYDGDIQSLNAVCSRLHWSQRERKMPHSHGHQTGFPRGTTGEG